jgi:hypothetical protein
MPTLAPLLPPTTNPNFEWAALLAGNQRFQSGSAAVTATSHDHSRPSVAIVNLTTADRSMAEIFDWEGHGLFVVSPCQGKLSTGDLSGLEYTVLVEGTRTIVVVVDAPSSLVPPPGYERLIWHIDPEYCGSQRQQEALRAVIDTMQRSAVIRKAQTKGKLLIIPATYDHIHGTVIPHHSI